MRRLQFWMVSGASTWRTCVYILAIYPWLAIQFWKIHQSWGFGSWTILKPNISGVYHASEHPRSNLRSILSKYTAIPLCQGLRLSADDRGLLCGLWHWKGTCALPKHLPTANVRQFVSYIAKWYRRNCQRWSNLGSSESCRSCCFMDPTDKIMLRTQSSLPRCK